MTVVLGETQLPIRIGFELPVTDEQLIHFCEANELARVERGSSGELIVMSPGFSDGGSTELDVGAELRAWARSDGRGKAFGPNAGFKLPDTSIRAADASWIRLDRWTALSEQQRKHSYAAICPEFVIEVRSATDRLQPLQEKMAMWIANGAELAWLIDPERKVVEIYRPGEDAEVHQDPTSVQGTGPVRGFELVMERVWG